MTSAMLNHPTKRIDYSISNQN